MAFADYKPERTEVRFGPDGRYSAQIRALNVADLSRIYGLYEAEIEDIYRSLPTDGNFDPENLISKLPITIAAVVRAAPEIIIEIIVTSSGEDSVAARAGIQSMALSDQTDVIGAILGITAKAEGGLGKVFGIVASLLKANLQGKSASLTSALPSAAS